MGIVRGWEVIKADSGIVRRSCHTPYTNVITDAGLDDVMGGGKNTNDALYGDALSTVRVGTDNTAPSQSHTALGNEVAATSTLFNQSDGSGSNFDYWWRRQTWEFGKAEANNTLAELGTGQSSTGIWMRQLFKDDQGNNTTISKQNDEILRIQYELRIYPDKTQKTKSLDVDTRGSVASHDVTYQPAQIDSFVWGVGGLMIKSDGFERGLGTWSDPTLYAVETNTIPSDFQVDRGSNALDSSDFGSYSLDSYTAGSFERTISFGPIPATEWNFSTGIGTIGFNDVSSSSEAMFLSIFDPKIDKTSNDELRNLEVVLRLSRVTV